MNEEKSAAQNASAEVMPPDATPSSSAPSPSSSTQPPGATSVGEAPARSSAGGGWALLLAVVALAGAGAAGWQTWEMRSRVDALRTELASRLANGDTVATEARAIARQQQESLAALQAQVGALGAKVEATEGQAEALEALYQQFSRSRDDRVVAEVEQAVTMAAQQLELAGNVGAALIALRNAEARLAAQDGGQFAALRRALARDIAQLEQQPGVDVADIALRLERLLERTAALPLAFERAPEATAPGAEETAVAPAPASDDVFAQALAFASELGRDVWRELRALVRVERLDQADPVLLAPEQHTFLRENLKLRLLTARLALLSRDGRTYGGDLAQARDWVERFFDLRDEGVKAALVELRALAAEPVAATPPTPTESLAALRLLQARTREPLPAVAVPPAAPAPVAEQPAPAQPAAPRE